MSGARDTEAAPPLVIAGVGLWMPGWPSARDWAAGTPRPEAVKPLGLAFDRVNRRRASLLGRALADASAEALAAAREDPATIATVIGSAIGEAATMLGLLDQMWRLRTPMSPAAFTMSVHNAASGLLSISAGNRGFTTSIAADADTPSAALLEAAGLIAATGASVLVACGDEVAPADLVPQELRFPLMAAALVLAPADHAGSILARVVPGLRDVPAAHDTLRAADVRRAADAPLAADMPRPGDALRTGDTLRAADAGPAMERHPQAGLLDLVAAVLRGESGIVRLDRGGGSGWCARLLPP